MPTPREPDGKATTEFLRRMSAGAKEVVDRVIPIASDDVAHFLANLRRFEEESRKVEIVVN